MPPFTSSSADGAHCAPYAVRYACMHGPYNRASLIGRHRIEYADNWHFCRTKSVMTQRVKQ
jgi:hypothetical protein